ncbi:MAG TPA: HlyD family efflux transporter periplasmic adaptor subunit [Woeseiaceae bacterium]|nr:HlyD family efflux transporter periplasmic adaptor subunit [Woeseiaceae bacterium]
MQLAPHRSRWRRPIIGSTALLSLLALAWIAVPAVNRWANATVTVPIERLRLATVTRGDLTRDVSVQGRVVAAIRPTLYAPAAGSITLRVTAGAEVSEGQVLADIDSPELENQLDQARATLEKQGVELERQRIESRQQALEKRKEADLAEVRLVAARREMRRAEQAKEKDVISVIDYEKAHDDLSNAELAHEHAIADADLFDERLAFEIRAAELGVRQQRLLVDNLQRQVDELAIKSPVSGIVGDLLVEQKAAVTRDTPVMAVVDLSKFEIEALIPESYADDLALGMQAEIHVGSDTYAGQLVAISPEIVSNQVSSRIRFADAMPPNIRQNQRLTTRVLLQEHPDVLTLPRGQFLDSGGGRIAYVLDDAGIAHRQAIAIGARSLSAVQVESGLAEGDRVIISSTDQFQGADTVVVTD